MAYLDSEASGADKEGEAGANDWFKDRDDEACEDVEESMRMTRLRRRVLLRAWSRGGDSN